MTVDAAIAAAERILPGQAAPAGETDARWQAVIEVSEFIETEPEGVWSFARKWGAHPDDDLRMAISTCILEHLLDQHFDTFIVRFEESARTDALFADAVTSCAISGRALESTRAARFGRLVESIRASQRRGKLGGNTR